MAKKSPFFWRATRAAKNPTKITHGPCASCRDRAGSSATRRLAARSDHEDELMHSCPRTRGPRLTGKKKTSEKKMRDQLGRSQLAAQKSRFVHTSRQASDGEENGFIRSPSRSTATGSRKKADQIKNALRSDAIRGGSDRFGTIQKQG